MANLRIARGQVTIIDQNDAMLPQAFISSNIVTTQLYNQDSGVYTPNWASGAGLILTPSVFCGSSVDKITSTGNASTLTPGIKAGSIKWFKGDKQIVSGQDGCTIGAAAAKYALTIKTNHLSKNNPQINYSLEGIFIDSNGLEIPFRVSMAFVQHISAGSNIVAVASTPNGSVFKNGEVPQLTATCQLWRGSVVDTTNVSYLWGVQDGSVWAPKTATAAVAKDASVIPLNNVDSISKGDVLYFGTATTVKYTVSNIDVAGKKITLTGGLSAAIASGTTVNRVGYNSKLGPGWKNVSELGSLVTGGTTNTITVFADAVLNFETFKCAVTDTDPSSSSYNTTVYDFVSFADLSDPIQVTVESKQGFIIKNNANNVDCTARLYRAGVEIDEDGTTYTYKWNLYNNAGTAIVQTLTGKTVTVDKSKVTGKGTIIVEISQ